MWHLCVWRKREKIDNRNAMQLVLQVDGVGA